MKQGHSKNGNLVCWRPNLKLQNGRDPETTNGCLFLEGTPFWDKEQGLKNDEPPKPISATQAGAQPPRLAGIPPHRWHAPRHHARIFADGGEGIAVGADRPHVAELRLHAATVLKLTRENVFLGLGISRKKRSWPFVSFLRNQTVGEPGKKYNMTKSNKKQKLYGTQCHSDCIPITPRCRPFGSGRSWGSPLWTPAACLLCATPRPG